MLGTTVQCENCMRPAPETWTVHMRCEMICTYQTVFGQVCSPKAKFLVYQSQSHCNHILHLEKSQLLLDCIKHGIRCAIALCSEKKIS